MDLTTLARVKRLLDPSMGASNDGELSSIITATSGILERYLDRYVERVSRTEYFDVEAAQLWIHLKGYPVTVLTSVANDTEVPRPGRHCWPLPITYSTRRSGITASSDSSRPWRAAPALCG